MTNVRLGGAVAACHCEVQPQLTQGAHAERGRMSIRTLDRWRSSGKTPAWPMPGDRAAHRMSDMLDRERAHRQSGDVE